MALEGNLLVDSGRFTAVVSMGDPRLPLALMMAILRPFELETWHFFEGIWTTVMRDL